ncbi:hypothetical protein JG688_00013937, partial [Phytophthora aleatoria]
LNLCNKAHKHYPGNTKTCFEIWHKTWRNGTKRPRPRCGRDIQSGTAGTGGGKNRKRRDGDQEEEFDHDENEEQEVEGPEGEDENVGMEEEEHEEEQVGDRDQQ